MYISMFSTILIFFSNGLFELRETIPEQMLVLKYISYIVNEHRYISLKEEKTAVHFSFGVIKDILGYWKLSICNGDVDVDKKHWETKSKDYRKTCELTGKDNSITSERYQINADIGIRI